MSNSRELISYVVQRVNDDKYALQVNHEMLKLICLVLTQEGIPTGFHFVCRENRLHSEELQAKLPFISNANTDIKASDFSEQELEIAERCIDLLCRMKNTEQVEITSAILYCYGALIQQSVPTEKQLFARVIAWNPAWLARMDFVVFRMRDLAELQWITINPAYDRFDFEEELF